MDKKKVLQQIKATYDNGENIIKFLKKMDGREVNSIEDIMISYDFQAGTYYNNYCRMQSMYKDYHSRISEVIKDLAWKGCSIMEPGVGEATTLAPVVKYVGEHMFEKAFGFDISWSRIQYAKKFVGEMLLDDSKVNLFVGDLLAMPIKDNSVDIVYTAHAIEPNGGKEEEILKELYRVTSTYLVLFEPAYELADEKSRQRMIENGYVTNLYETAVKLGYQIEKYELLGVSLNPNNPTGVMVIKKEKQQEIQTEIFCDPVSKESIEFRENVAFCESSMLAYPILEGVPMLTEENAIVATKYKEFFG